MNTFGTVCVLAECPPHIETQMKFVPWQSPAGQGESGENDVIVQPSRKEGGNSPLDCIDLKWMATSLPEQTELRARCLIQRGSFLLYILNEAHQATPSPFHFLFSHTRTLYTSLISFSSFLFCIHVHLLIGPLHILVILHNLYSQVIIKLNFDIDTYIILLQLI